MNYKELMCGDWVKVDQTTETVNAKVLGVYKDGINYEVDYSGVRATNQIHTDYVSPIELTEDILVKNGFDIEPCGCVWYQEHGISEQNYIVVSFYKNGEVRKVELSFVNKVHGEFRDIYTLHQLQHLLRLCGIEKEIEL